MRHWKQQWDPNAALVFLKRLRMGDDPENPYVLPGDPVTKAIRAKLGTNRLRRWWEARVVGLADWLPNSGRQARRHDAPPPTPPGEKTEEPKVEEPKVEDKPVVKKAAKKATKKKATRKKAAKKKAAKKTASRPKATLETWDAHVPGDATSEERTEFEGHLKQGLSEVEAAAVVWPGR